MNHLHKMFRTQTLIDSWVENKDLQSLCVCIVVVLYELQVWTESLLDFNPQSWPPFIMGVTNLCEHWWSITQIPWRMKGLSKLQLNEMAISSIWLLAVDSKSMHLASLLFVILSKLLKPPACQTSPIGPHSMAWVTLCCLPWPLHGCQWVMERQEEKQERWLVGCSGSNYLVCRGCDMLRLIKLNI